jgi:hypothetical protein
MAALLKDLVSEAREAATETRERGRGYISIAAGWLMTPPWPSRGPVYAPEVTEGYGAA